MTSKETAQQHNINTIDSNATLSDEKQQKLEQLKQLVPNLINTDNQIDTTALQDFIDITHTTSNNKGYELTFAGKGIARAAADTPTEMELKAEQEQSKNFETTQNVVIRGDNIDVLKILKQNYHGKIKMIYIDPPYNTKSENFVYKDNFKQSDEQLIEQYGLDEETTDFLQNVYSTRSHSGWLSFMYPRLKLARDLLTDEGVIFISIDDNEQANLKILCDEIFGETNLISSIVWEKIYTTKNDSLQFSDCHEYILCYAKNYTEKPIELLPRTAEMDARYTNSDNDTRGAWKPIPLYAKGERKNGRYIITSPKTGKKFEVGPNQHWLYTQEDTEKLIKDNRIYFGKDGNGQPNLKRFLTEVQQGTKAKSLWFHKDVGSNDSAKRQVRSLFEDEPMPFDFPKPTGIIERMIHLTCSNGDDYILDFFAGSGTTGDAVMQLNAEDGGNRKFILAQWDESINENSEAHNFCTDNGLDAFISSITIERLKRAGEKIKKEIEEKNDGKTVPDIGYKVFSLTPKPKLTTESDGDLITIDNQRTEKYNTLINMLCATCKTLDTKITEIKANLLYQADNEIYVLGNISYEELTEYKDQKINIDGYCDLSLGDWLNLDIFNKKNITVVY